MTNRLRYSKSRKTRTRKLRKSESCRPRIFDSDRKTSFKALMNYRVSCILIKKIYWSKLKKL